jgi:hypothetical protein
MKTNPLRMIRVPLLPLILLFAACASGEIEFRNRAAVCSSFGIEAAGCTLGEDVYCCYLRGYRFSWKVLLMYDAHEEVTTLLMIPKTVLFDDSPVPHGIHGYVFFGSHAPVTSGAIAAGSLSAQADGDMLVVNGSVQLRAGANASGLFFGEPASDPCWEIRIRRARLGLDRSAEREVLRNSFLRLQPNLNAWRAQCSIEGEMVKADSSKSSDPGRSR